jgi:hypothetical protein
MWPIAETSAKDGAAGRPANSANNLLMTTQEHIAPFAPDCNIVHRYLTTIKMLDDKTDYIGIVRTCQAPIAADDHNKHIMDLRSARQQRMQAGPSRLPGNVRQHLPGFGGIWRVAVTAATALRTLLALTASRARVTCEMFLMLRIRIRISRAEAMLFPFSH